MLSDAVMAHLNEEIRKPDPWGLDRNAYEQHRYARMLELLSHEARFGHAFEVGCAAGAFTERLAVCCDHLHVVDILPAAIERCRGRLHQCKHITYSIGDVLAIREQPGFYDLIVAAEVLYYLPNRASIAEATRKLASGLRPGGTLLFGSAIDRICELWGLAFGAETVMNELERWLVKRVQTTCIGSSINENSIIASYTR